MQTAQLLDKIQHYINIKIEAVEGLSTEQAHNCKHESGSLLLYEQLSRKY